MKQACKCKKPFPVEHERKSYHYCMICELKIDMEKTRSNEIFLVETINTLYGKRYAVVSHEGKIGNNKRILSLPMFEYSPKGLERANRSAEKFRREAEVFCQ